jgi:hypothetical protein
MHGRRVHAGLPGENRGRTVPLVHVTIHDGNPPDESAIEQSTRGDGDVVEDAVAFAGIRKGVVRAAREVDREAAV